jgi:hypothetical protein
MLNQEKGVRHTEGMIFLRNSNAILYSCRSEMLKWFNKDDHLCHSFKFKI